jgi:hypothetical protein
LRKDNRERRVLRNQVKKRKREGEEGGGEGMNRVTVRGGYTDDEGALYTKLIMAVTLKRLAITITSARKRNSSRPIPILENSDKLQ